jgi:hypothetical protein
VPNPPPQKRSPKTMKKPSAMLKFKFCLNMGVPKILRYRLFGTQKNFASGPKVQKRAEKRD